jgi:hypothetical protein
MRRMLDSEWRFLHEWFAGWRWECHRDGVLLTESLQNFETREECEADAKQHGHAGRERHASTRHAPGS